jgi:hypothetical protein
VRIVHEDGRTEDVEPGEIVRYKGRPPIVLHDNPSAEDLLLQLVDALPKTEFWTPKLHTAEKAARAFLDSRKKRNVKK